MIEQLLYFGLLFHFIGDYVTQSDWMASDKTSKFLPAFIHATIYSLPFLFIVTVPGFLIILLTHFLIDRYRLARYVCWLKNLMAPKSYRHKWSECSNTGYHDSKPPWLTVWLMIITDNVMHVCINTFAIIFFNIYL